MSLHSDEMTGDAPSGALTPPARHKGLERAGLVIALLSLLAALGALALQAADFILNHRGGM